MINFHLNGDIVRCPDIKAIQIRARERKDHLHICKYNIKEDTCQCWLNHINCWMNVKWYQDAGRCNISGSPACPGSQRQKQLGQLTKSFSIDSKKYRQLASSAHYLVKESKSKSLFLTLTFPNFIKKTTDNEINQAFSKFVENLRTNYDCQGYIAVREFGKRGGRIHFHLLCALPFVPFAVLNRAWCSAISDISVFSKNAVTSDPKTKFVKNPVRAMRYVCKYFAKCKGQRSGSRMIFISNNIIKKPISVTGVNIIDELKGYKGIFINQSEFTTTFRITDRNSFIKFCDIFLYPLFELSPGIDKELYCFPSDSS